MSIREVKESPLEQGVDEEIQYQLTTTPWGSSPTSVSVVVKDDSDGADITATVMPVNSPSVAGDVITLSPLKSLTAGDNYRVEIKFTAGGNVWETYLLIKATP
jgi:hypothetical protein